MPGAIGGKQSLWCQASFFSRHFFKIMSRQEKLIIIFLLITAAVGLSISAYKKINPAQIKVAPSYIQKESADLEGKISSRRLININTSDKEELTQIPGIGPALARKIIAYREKNGLFYFPEDITKVPGIGKVKYERIKDFITTEDE